MIDYETIARRNHNGGMNCSASVYEALGLGSSHKTVAPKPRSEGGKCGAVLAAEQVIRENGGMEEDILKFEKRFTDKFQHLKCSELRGFSRGKCNDYVGAAASIVGWMGILHDSE